VHLLQPRISASLQEPHQREARHGVLEPYLARRLEGKSLIPKHFSQRPPLRKRDIKDTIRALPRLSWAAVLLLCGSTWLGWNHV